jgi:hypothetical protein
MAESKGRKRLASSILAVVGIILSQLFGLNDPGVLLQIAGGGVGIVGLGHAVRAKTVSKRKLTSIASVLAAILALAQSIPALEPYVPIIQAIVALLAALGIGNEVVQKVKK